MKRYKWMIKYEYEYECVNEYTSERTYDQQVSVRYSSGEYNYSSFDLSSVDESGQIGVSVVMSQTSLFSSLSVLSSLSIETGYQLGWSLSGGGVLASFFFITFITFITFHTVVSALFTC